MVSPPGTLLYPAVEQSLLHEGTPWVAFYDYSPGVIVGCAGARLERRPVFGAQQDERAAAR